MTSCIGDGHEIAADIPGPAVVRDIASVTRWNGKLTSTGRLIAHRKQDERSNRIMEAVLEIGLQRSQLCNG